MKTLLTAAALTLLPLAALADPIEGLWQTEADEGAFALVQVVPCGAAFCGTIVKTYRGRNQFASPNVGKQIVIGMTPSGNGSYKGRVLRPADNRIYNGKATVAGKSMSLAGCVAGGLICKSQTWTRLK